MEYPSGRALRDSWNAEYRERGRLYGGAPFPLPDLPRGSRVLDLGCGNGKHHDAMKARAWEIIGIDHAEEAIRLCTTRRHLVIGDASRLPFKDGSFHAIIGIHILGHLPDAMHRHLIDEAFRIVASGGVFSCTVFSREDMRCGKGEEIHPFTYRRRGIITRYFTEDELLRMKGPFQDGEVSRESHPVRFSGKRYTREYITCTFFKL